MTNVISSSPENRPLLTELSFSFSDSFYKQVAPTALENERTARPPAPHRQTHSHPLAEGNCGVEEEKGVVVGAAVPLTTNPSELGSSEGLVDT